MTTQGRRALTLVVNPSSGGGRAARLAGPVAAALRESFDVTVTCFPDMGDPAVGTVVAVLGGDGTIGHVAATTLGLDIVLAPLPGGRGNDLCRRLGVPSRAVRAARALVSARERRIDLGLVGRQPFAGVVSIGFDAATNAFANATRVPGPAAYVWGGLRALLASDPVDVRVSVDGVVTSHHAWLVSVSNSGSFGGGRRISPRSLLDDGVLEVVVVERRSRRGLVVVLVRLLVGRHLGMRGVTVRSGRTARVEELVAGPGGPAACWADGEQVGELPADVRVLPAVLRVLA